MVLTFHPELGTAQGGVDSSLVFASFMDILITAIDVATRPEDTFYISDIDGNLQPTQPIGFVDDLICVQGTERGLQRTADIVSAFASMFNLTLNTTKFRAFAVNHILRELGAETGENGT